MIELIPAIDIINGECVRLTKGDYSQKKVYGKPIDMARTGKDWFQATSYGRLGRGKVQTRCKC